LWPGRVEHMRVGLPQLPGAVETSGHGIYNETMLEGFFDQDQHTAVVLEARDRVTRTVPHPHEHRTFRPVRNRLALAFAYDPSLELFASAAATRARCDVVVANAQWPMPRVPRRPHVCVLYESELIGTHPWGMYTSRFLRTGPVFLRRNLASASAVVAISHHAKRTAVRDLGIDPARVLVAPPALRPFGACEDCRGLPARPYIAMIGWFHPRKDLPLALAAWRLAHERGLDHDLVLIGGEGGPDHVHGTVARRITEGAGSLSDHVHVTGTVDRPHLGHLLQGAAGLLVTSHHEGFGIPVIEALACEVPVVAVSRGSLPEVVGAHGTLGQPTAEAMAEALLAAVGTTEHATAGREYAEAFTADRQMAGVWAALQLAEADA
jgi:glycosyltransferase involved in cell wall biosynthesis